MIDFKLITVINKIEGNSVFCNFVVKFNVPAVWLLVVAYFVCVFRSHSFLC